MTKDAFREAGLAYASRGERVLPIFGTEPDGTCCCPAGAGCQNNPGKHPIGKLVPNGVHDATTDPEVIESWASWYSGANIGRATDNRPTIDIDLSDVADPVAQDVALALETELIRTPGRNGLHIVLATEVPIRGRNLYLSDGRVLGQLKGEGGYALVPPSRIGDRSYERLSPEEVVPLKVDDPEAWLWKLLPAFGFELAEGRPSGERVDTAAVLAGVPEGQRDQELFRLASKLRNADVPRPIAETLVLQAAQNCRPAFPPDNALAKVESAYSRYDPLPPNRNGSAPDAAPAVFEAQTVGAFLAEEIPGVDAILTDGGQGAIVSPSEKIMLGGPPGVGKTNLVMNMGAGLAAGTGLPGPSMRTPLEHALCDAGGQPQAPPEAVPQGARRRRCRDEEPISLRPPARPRPLE